MTDPIPVFICSHNRPLYLWASLDSFYRGTAYPHKFIFVDMASDDPLVRHVVAGFERRGMFSEVVWLPRNDLAAFWAVVWDRLPALGPFAAAIDGDVIVEATEPCWLSIFAGLMRDNPRLAMLGSVIDKRDFVDLETARRLEPDIDDKRLENLTKSFSPERHQDPSAAGGPIFRPHNPAGRLAMVRTAALAEIGPGSDGALNGSFLQAGYETGIATAVRHRHLSLLHLYDYPKYDYERRDAYMSDMLEIRRPERRRGLLQSARNYVAARISSVRRHGAWRHDDDRL